jgi:hypothetical protein
MTRRFELAFDRGAPCFALGEFSAVAGLLLIALIAGYARAELQPICQTYSAAKTTLDFIGASTSNPLQG